MIRLLPPRALRDLGIQLTAGMGMGQRGDFSNQDSSIPKRTSGHSLNQDEIMLFPLIFFPSKTGLTLRSMGTPFLAAASAVQVPAPAALTALEVGGRKRKQSFSRSRFQAAPLPSHPSPGRAHVHGQERSPALTEFMPLAFSPQGKEKMKSGFETQPRVK